MDAGIPEYRDFLFEALQKSDTIKELLVVHSGVFYSRTINTYPNKRLRFLGNNKLGIHLGLFQIIKKYDIVFSSYNLRIVSCWFPIFLFSTKRWIFWGKGLGERNTWIVKSLRKVIANKAHKVLVYNEHTKNKLVQELNVNPEKVWAFGNTVKITNPGYEKNNTVKHFLYFGRLQERKGLEKLIDAFASYTNSSNNNQQYRLRFVGNGQIKDQLKDKVNTLGVEEHVDFFDGAYNDAEIKKHFKNAVAYVSPDNVGLAIINSFAYGVPVITVKGKQVAPEFYLLNKSNSIVCEHYAELAQVFCKITQDFDLLEMKESCYQFYIKNLAEEKMISTFINSIKS